MKAIKPKDVTIRDTNNFHFDQDNTGASRLCLNGDYLWSCLAIGQSNTNGYLLGNQGNRIWYKGSFKRPPWCFRRNYAEHMKKWLIRDGKLRYETTDAAGHIAYSEPYEMVYIGNSNANNDYTSYYYCGYSSTLQTNSLYNDQFRCQVKRSGKECCGYNVNRNSWMKYYGQIGTEYREEIISESECTFADQIDGLPHVWN